MRIIGMAQLTHDKESPRRFPDEGHIFLFFQKANDENLWIKNQDSKKSYRSGWNDFSHLKKSPSYQGFRLEFIYE